MQGFELEILNWIQVNLRCGILDAVMPAVSWICNHGEVWILLAVALLLLYVPFCAARKLRNAALTAALDEGEGHAAG